MTDPGPSKELLDRVRDGDPEAATIIYELYAETVYFAALKLLPEPDDAKDILQEVFLGLPQAVAKFGRRGSFEGWLRRVTVRLALMELRTRKTRKEVPLESAPAGRTSRRSESVVERIAIEEAIGTLSEEQRMVYVLKGIEGYSHSDIAELLSITRLASRSRYMRAMRQLRQVLGDD